MSERGDRLRAARIAAGFETAAAAARAMGIPEGRYAHHENGTRKYNFETAERYASKLKTNPEWLMGGKYRHISDGGSKGIREVTKLSWVAAGRLGPVEPIESANIEGRFRVDLLPPGDWIALDVRGHSMERIAPEGSIILINRRDRTLVQGKFYVVIADDGEATFKRYRSSPSRFVPFSLDADEEPLYPDLDTDRDWRVLGRVRRIIIDV